MSSLANEVDSTQEHLDAQAHLWNLIFNYINSMSLKSAIELGIPDIIHEHGKPITLSQLAEALNINKAKSHALFRLMRLLVHSKIFDKVKISKGEGEGEGEDVDEDGAYSLTRVSQLLVREEPLSFASFALAMTDSKLTDPFQQVTEWFRDESPSPFFSRHGSSLFELLGFDKKWNKLFNEGMGSDAKFVATILLEKCRHVFEGLKSLVDVGGGTGVVAKAVAGAFSDVKCVVLELPHVIKGLEDSENLSFVSGDMFEFIPPADAVFLKWILHDWSDQDCVRILRKCKESILPSKDNGGKVIILEMVLEDERKEDEETQTQAQLFFDMMMMTACTGKERSEKEWANLVSTAGFKNYKITPVLGLRSIIEVFP